MCSACNFRHKRANMKLTTACSIALCKTDGTRAAACDTLCRMNNWSSQLERDAESPETWFRRQNAAVTVFQFTNYN